ncbi:zinc-binding dehydrogenase, partial [Stenotrophomonas maltophilia]
RHWKVGPGQKVGVIGLGGLGHMGVKFAKALGAHCAIGRSARARRSA